MARLSRKSLAIRPFRRHYERVDYNLGDLGTRNFEQLIQAVTTKVVGPKVSTFGDGPDGGREATWRGPASSLGALASWEGYGVLQAKYMVTSGEPAANLAWLKKTVKKELDDWFSSASKRLEKPNYLLFATNVRLSAVPDHGKDAIKTYIDGLLAGHGSTIREIRVWDYWDIAALLDDAPGIRSRYAAFTTSGDIINALIEQINDVDTSLARGMFSYVARSIRDERLVNLTQGGAVSDDQVTIGDVFVDLPATLPPQNWLDAPAGVEAIVGSPEGSLGDDLTMDHVDSRWAEEDHRAGIAAHLINNFNRLAPAYQSSETGLHRVVLVAGPGQGKSTVTQWLAQVYRAEFLRDSTAARPNEIASIVRKIDSRSMALALPKVVARRWPIRIILTELADFLAANPDKSLLHFMTSKINHGGSYVATPEDLRRWMTTYPWLVLIDGLDEVPATSNREHVMRVIGDFFIDVATLECDVAAVATTRPQGYSDEFSPQEFQHFELSLLTTDEALVYAAALVTVRSGVNTTKATKVMDRLRRASSEEHTQRLMESPLQVTILTILLEKLGKAPGDRSRLFSQYYSIISQREQEKSGDLSDLIQRFETDIDFLHRKVGFLLQERSARSGETTSSLLLDEFDTLIVARFRQQGHEGDELERIVGQFKNLVTDRLVFLAKLQSDRVGFDLRSLQEFMAAEWIVHHPEPDIMNELFAVARSSFWRNVTLFAVGSIFSKKEHLRAEVSLLCERLNSESDNDAILLPGSDLALDIIKDGSATSMPIYSRSLAEKAVLIVGRPGHEFARGLLPLLSSDVSEIIWRDLESTVAAPLTTWRNRAVLLATLAESEPRASNALDRLVLGARDELRTELCLVAWETRLPALCWAVSDMVHLVPPRVFLQRPTAHRGIYGYDGPVESGLPDWVKNLALLTIAPGSRRRAKSQADAPSAPTTAQDASGIFRLSFSALFQDSDAWSWLENAYPGAPAWHEFRFIAAFALRPNPETLASALEHGIGDVGRSAPLRVIPWVLTACLRFLDQKASDDVGSHSWNTERQALVTAARQGALGDLASWLAAETRWQRDSVIDVELFHEVVVDHGLPVWSGIGGEGFAYYGMTFSTHNVRGRSVPEIVNIVREISKVDEDISNLPLFLASTDLVRALKASPEVADELTSEVAEVRKMLEEVVRRSSRRHSWWTPWVTLGGVASWDNSNRDVLDKMAHSTRLLGNIGASEARAMLDHARQSTPGQFSLIRIALAGHPRLLNDMQPSDVHVSAESDFLNEAEALKSALELLHSDSGHLGRGNADAALLALAQSQDTLGGAWFAAALQRIGGDSALNVLARGARILADVRPDLAEAWMSRSLELTSANDVGPFAVDFETD
jgi:hypothetical protein